MPVTRKKQVVPDMSLEIRNDAEAIDHEEQIINLLNENENLKQEIRILHSEIKELQADLTGTLAISCRSGCHVWVYT